MLSKPFEIVIKELCEQVLPETNLLRLSEKIIDHVQKTFSVEWSTLWLTVQKNAQGEKQLRLAAAAGKAKRLLTAENKEPAVYDFGEGLTGTIAEAKQTRNYKNPEEIQKDPHRGKYDIVMYDSQEEAKKSCRCVLGVPLLLRSSAPTEPSGEIRVIGVIKLENKKPESGGIDYFTDDDARILEGYAAVIAVALEKAQMREDSIHIGQGLLEISESLLARLGKKPDLKDIVKKTATVISADGCSLWLRYGTQLRLEAAHGYPGELSNIPPYKLETGNDDKHAGLTVFVAHTREPLNLKSMDEIKKHFAWSGVNDQKMWKKQRGEACYSVMAIPLIDNETEDVKGVFKIENKRKTIFQLENYFTPQDAQLLTTLGNSISLSLIISERFDRLKRLEELVSKIRVLDSLEKALFFILTGLTHGSGLKYNRAMIFLYEEKDSQKELICRFAIGPLTENEWEEMNGPYSNFTEHEFEKDLDDRLNSFQKNKEKFCNNPMMNKWKCTKILLDDDTQAISYHAKNRPETKKYLSKDLSWPDILAKFPHGDYVLIPISQDQELLGIIYADNRFTGNPITQFECEVLDIFSGIAAALIQASKVPEKLKTENEKAWRKFSQPAAHRLGTETSIIDGEIKLFCKPQLENMRRILSKKDPAPLNELEKSLTNIEGSVECLRQAAKDYQQLTPDPEPSIDFELNQMIKDVVEKTTKRIRNLTVDMQIEERPIVITAYKNKLIYVFEELLLNAWKELDQGRVNQMSIKVELWRNEEKVFCRISDTGLGIPPHVIPKIFKEPIKGRPGGTGLGMFLISRRIEENGGRIKLSNGKPANYGGASFLVTLPLKTLAKN